MISIFAFLLASVNNVASNMRTLITGDEREQKTIDLIGKSAGNYRRIIVISAVTFENVDNQFKEIPIDIMETALWLCNKYPERQFPFLFVFHGMCWDLSHNCKPFYAEFFEKTNWIVTAMRPDSMPMFIRNNVTKK